MFKNKIMWSNKNYSINIYSYKNNYNENKEQWSIDYNGLFNTQAITIYSLMPLKVGYDFPERLPKYVKEKLISLIKEYYKL